jgi:tRNA(Ile)-lysidine synthase
VNREQITRFSKDLKRCGVGEDDKIIAACSGGADSMFLLHAFKEAQVNFEVAHVNFQLRGEESDGDEKSVKTWCDNNNVHLSRISLSTKEEAVKSGNGTQAAARKLRYDYFEKLLYERKADYIAVAHHKNDQAETLILHLLRSVDPDALGCMSMKTGNVIRPLLEWTSKEIEEEIKNDGVVFREDSSNTDPKYTRNRIRHEVLPLLEDIRAGSTEHLAEWTDRLEKQANAIESTMDDASRVIVEYSDGEYNDGFICKLRIKAMEETPWGVLVYEKLLAERNWPHGAREEALLLKRSMVGAMICYGDDTLIRERDHIVLSRDLGVVREIELKTQEISEPKNQIFPSSNNILWVDKSTLVEPTIWRTWEDGDRISPSGMEGSVKISDLLTQWKVPHRVRKSAHLLVDGSGEVLWAVVDFERETLSRVSKNVSATLDGEVVEFVAQCL